MNTNEERFEGVQTNKKYLTFAQVASIAAEIQTDCSDYNVKDVTSKNVYYNADTNRLHFSGDMKNGCQLTPYSLSQLCSRLNVPTRYIRRCIEEGNPYLAAENINQWLDEYHANLFIRTYKDTVRGILSDRYSCLDAPDVIATVRENSKGLHVKGFTINPERFHMRLAQNEMLPIKGEDLFIGIEIDSSDVGRSVLSARFFLYKQVCTNGMCIYTPMGEVFVQKHMGLTIVEFREALKEKVKLLPDMQAVIVDAVKEGGFKNFKSLKSAVAYRTWNEDNQNAFVANIKGLTRMTEDDILTTIDTMYEKYSTTPWGFVNALTEQAQQYTLERRIEIERFASQILFGQVHIF